VKRIKDDIFILSQGNILVLNAPNSMYNLKRNNYHQNPKNSSIQTPLEVSRFIFELLKDKIGKKGIILDPGCGKGNLLEP
jgi:type I restriction-modification system DNA methylase subunit